MLQANEGADLDFLVGASGHEVPRTRTNRAADRNLGTRSAVFMSMRTLSTATLVTAALVATSLLAGCASAGNGTPAAGTSASGTPATATSASPSASASPAPVTATPAPGGVFNRVLTGFNVTLTGGGFYLTWQINPNAISPTVLERVDQATGAIEATHRFGPGYLGAPLAAAGWLWVAISTVAGESLLRMNPASLAVTQNLRVGSDSSQGGLGPGDQLALAGGALWVAAGNQLLRVSLPGGQVTARIALPGAVTSGVDASADGSVLIVSEADNGGSGSLQRRDPVTGALLASHPMFGVVAPEIGGVIDGGAWVSEPTGMLGYVERFRTATMAPVPATRFAGTNGINVVVADGVVWVTDLVGGASANYCANPVTGHRLATIPMPRLSEDRLLAVSGQYLYYQAPADNGFALEEAPVPVGCRA